MEAIIRCPVPIGSTTYYFNPSQYTLSGGTGCNDIVNGGSNDSPLICPITETFPTISDASSGPNGAEFSRVVGGIHTPLAVEDALTLGDAVGEVLASENNIPEPDAFGLFAMALGFLASLRRLRSARPESRRSWGRRLALPGEVSGSA